MCTIYLKEFYQCAHCCAFCPHLFTLNSLSLRSVLSFFFILLHFVFDFFPNRFFPCSVYSSLFHSTSLSIDTHYKNGDQFNGNDENVHVANTSLDCSITLSTSSPTAPAAPASATTKALGSVLAAQLSAS